MAYVPQTLRQGLTALVLVGLLFASGYWYFEANAICDVPIAYRIGAIDPMFDIGYEEARTAVSAAESLWEDATGRNLFTHDPTAEFTIQFVFDDRQAYTNEEEELREVLEEKEDLSDSIKNQYDYLLEKYDDIKLDYENRSAEYEGRLQAYNAEVQRWNDVGGAPQDIYENLEARQDELAEEQKELNNIAHSLNELVHEMNNIGERGNTLINDYNEVVETYNERFNEEREFTQGDYQGDKINIYQFDSAEELEIVLAHEFGHALSLEHVDGETSIMFHFMGEQSPEKGLTTFDTTEFERVCGSESFTLWSIL